MPVENRLGFCFDGVPLGFIQCRIGRTSKQIARHTYAQLFKGLPRIAAIATGPGQSAHGILTDADLPWPKFKLATGEEITLDQSAYTKYRESNDRAERKRVLDSFAGTFKTFERSLGALLYSQLKQDAVYSEVRKYPDSITRILDAERMTVAVIDTLVAQTNANLATLHRYFRLRAKLLGVTDMGYHDIYSPLVKGEYRFPISLVKRRALQESR